MRKLHKVTFILLVIGGLNWLLYVLGLEVGSFLPGGMTGTAAMVVYVLVGLSAVNEIIIHKGTCRACNPGTSGTMM